ncbi:beta-aspartyl-peptidase [Rhodobacteraceae bacterium RKSG542]|uniref:beta-aspartyl-peptidase n=1 Tax=Pseudovibrio flavus TaxID=2529854 RepID=UPI0012BB6C61|nr:beta-aspartyl-peptidase [Pseudovibrio flavus]MTI18964.1 beta-aspartyl-peptidase [Pseudovibrio flavus]
MQLLIKGADIFAPEALGKKDILIAAGKIIAIEDAIDTASLVGSVEVIDGTGKIAIPGLVDTHQHFIGGGGEGGYQTRTPELTLTQQTLNGVTTALGLLGTDSLSRHVESLYAKTMAFNAEGITARMITGAYHLPSPTITGSVQRDIAFIDPVIGVKLALADHRGPFVTREELGHLVSEVRVASLIAAKKGIITVHTGIGKAGLDQVFDILEISDYQPERFVPTHINREDIWPSAVKLAKMGAFIDGTGVLIDDGSRGKMTCAEATRLSIEEGIANRFTFSSDAGGSMPRWNEDRTRIVGMGVGTPDSLLIEVRRGVEKGLTLSQMLAPVTANAAHQMGLEESKGHLATGFDGDVVLLDNSTLMLTDTIAKGRIMVADGEAVVKGTFE